jgi:hypothetical protein
LKHLATLGHPGAETDASVVLYQLENGTVFDSLAGEDQTKEEVKEHLERAEQYAKNLRDSLAVLQAEGTHPTLVTLFREFDYKTVTVEGGYDFVGKPELRLDNGNLTIEAVYAHGDAPEHKHDNSLVLSVKDGRLVEPYDREDLADANDLEACKEAVRKLLYYEGGY